MLLQMGDIDLAHKGKMECCLRSLLLADPGRHRAKRVVFNGQEAVLMIAVRDGVDVRFLESSPLGITTCGWV
jgi:hypothetical protein